MHGRLGLTKLSQQFVPLRAGSHPICLFADADGPFSNSILQGYLLFESGTAFHGTASRLLRVLTAGLARILRFGGKLVCPPPDNANADGNYLFQQWAGSQSGGALASLQRRLRLLLFGM